MELSRQLIENINNLSDDDKKLLIGLIEKMTKKEEHSNISIFEKNNSAIKISKATKFPIHNTLLKEESDYIKGLYFQCLAVALTSIKDNKEDPLYLFNRLLAGAEIDGDIEFYLKKAYSLEKEQLYDFLEEIKFEDLAYRFIIDFIVLLGSDNLKKENLTIITEFCEALEIETDEVEFLFNIASSILTQDINLYWKLTNQNNSCIKPNIVSDYMTFDKTKTEEIYKKASNIFKEAIPLLQKLEIPKYEEEDEGAITKDWIHASLWAEEILDFGIESRKNTTFSIAYKYMSIEEYGCSDTDIQNKFYKKAISLWKKLIDLGDVGAATNLGWMYENGRAVEKSDIEAFKYYKIAADRGDNVGQCNLAWNYENGCGIEKDINKAIFWYKKSAEQGDQRAKDALKRLGVRY